MARLIPFRKSAARPLAEVKPRFQFTASGQLMLSTDGGRTWVEAVSVEPGYRHLELWQHGPEMHLRLDYADRSVEWLSTHGGEWHTA